MYKNKTKDDDVEKKTKRFWKCYWALRDIGCNSKSAYTEATRQLGYSAPHSADFIKKHNAPWDEYREALEKNTNDLISHFLKARDGHV